ncbi:hypothetical protein FIBSPDRAFT_847749 [Athelia psychrophila]|uniref:Uncharacterized protein n=1 Tax=Athelia psychrophila TaxID=1759441 RepID=A0A166VX07_9AGAM|nr:hypothetical protein FIBSPDRAFT_847746 [Fibularhizoctonia sp. CBS 109695]KZP33151.1 hypothetical protein FIBSPDRAFT_847749 [Fibularhizoctonia sp. CBS 109695]
MLSPSSLSEAAPPIGAQTDKHRWELPGASLALAGGKEIGQPVARDHLASEPTGLAITFTALVQLVILSPSSTSVQQFACTLGAITATLAFLILLIDFVCFFHPVCPHTRPTPTRVILTEIATFHPSAADNNTVDVGGTGAGLLVPHPAPPAKSPAAHHDDGAP